MAAKTGTSRKNKDDIFYGFVLNEYQQKFVDAIMSDDHNFILVDATAGSGKTLLAIACANLLINRDNKYDSATFIFPTVEESSLGYRQLALAKVSEAKGEHEILDGKEQHSHPYSQKEPGRELSFPFSASIFFTSS